MKHHLLAGITVLLALAPLVSAQCDDCPMKKGEAVDQTIGWIDIAVDGLDTDDARKAVLRGLEFLLEIGEDTLTLTDGDTIRIPVAAGRAVRLGGIEQGLTRIAEASKLPGAKFTVLRDRVRLGGPVRVTVSGVRCGNCAAKITGRLNDGESSFGATVTTAEEQTGLVAFAADGTALVDFVKRLEGSHFEVVDVEVGFDCPEGGCEGGECPHAGKAEGAAKDCPHAGKAEGAAKDCPHAAKEEQDEQEAPPADKKKDGCCPEGADGAEQLAPPAEESVEKPVGKKDGCCPSSGKTDK